MKTDVQSESTPKLRALPNALLIGLLSPLLVFQGIWVRKNTPRLGEAPGDRNGRIGTGPPLRLLALGDSIIAGVGVKHMQLALPAQLSMALSELIDRRVCWTCHGVNGSRTSDLLKWVAVSDEQCVDLIVVSNGLNDVTSTMRLGQWLIKKRALYAGLQRLAPNAHIAQLGLPPLGHFPALPRPLRGVLGRRAQNFDLALATLIEGYRKVSHLPFREIPETSLFAADGYHPGSEAVKLWAGSLATEIYNTLDKHTR